MYKDIIHYSLADGVSEEHLLQISGQIIEKWMRIQQGFISWEIHKNKTGDYTDIVCWKSKGDAQKAELEMVNIPNANDWYSCYKEGSISSQNIERIGLFK